MHRTNIYLSDEQRDELDARARGEGVSRAELVRRVLDRAMRGESDQVSADLAAITDSFGALRDEEFVPERGDGARGAHLERLASR